MKKYHVVFSLLIGSLIFCSCKRDPLGDFVGPSLCPTDDFAYTQNFALSSSSIDLNSGALNLSAEFNESLPWEITVTGQTSGAVKKFSGSGNTVGIDWRGNADEGSSFFQNENVNVAFTLACSESIVETATITANNNFIGVGSLLEDFDGNGYVNYSFPPYGLYIVNAESGVRNDRVGPSPQGGNYYALVGNSSGTPVWGFGGFWGNLNMSFLSTNDPTKVYFNVFLNSNGVKNSDISFTFRENGVSKNYRVTADWDGWKMVSFPLSDAGVLDPSLVTQMDIYLGSAPAQGTTGEINIDFCIFTENASFYGN